MESSETHHGEREAQLSRTPEAPPSSIILDDCLLHFGTSVANFCASCCVFARYEDLKESGACRFLGEQSLPADKGLIPTHLLGIKYARGSPDFKLSLSLSMTSTSTVSAPAVESAAPAVESAAPAVESAAPAVESAAPAAVIIFPTFNPAKKAEIVKSLRFQGLSRKEAEAWFNARLSEAAAVIQKRTAIKLAYRKNGDSSVTYRDLSPAAVKARKIAALEARLAKLKA